MQSSFPIGVFDSGYGGLTILKDLQLRLPQHDFIYLGDNARTPYGNRSFETVYQYTLQCVDWLFKQNCPLVILACNTASAKALRTIQQNDLKNYPGKKVLGVIRPTTEILGMYSETKQVGILATQGTVASNTYVIELKKFFPELSVIQQACPMWVPLVENNEHLSKGADFFLKKDIHELFLKGGRIDAVLLACTHFPLLRPLLENYLPMGISLLSQGELVANSLQDYLFRHPEVNEKCSKQSITQFYTTDDEEIFSQQANIFYGKPIKALKTDVVN